MMKRLLILLLPLLFVASFSTGCKPAATPKPEAYKRSEAPEPMPEKPAEAPATASAPKPDVKREKKLTREEQEELMQRMRQAMQSAPAGETEPRRKEQEAIERQIKPEIMPKPSPMPDGETEYAQPKAKTQYEMSKSTKKYKEYKVELAADPTIKMPGPPGSLRVWIGIPGYKPSFREGMNIAQTTLLAEGVVTARITPFAPAFKVNPAESSCMKIDPAGSEVGFKLIPTKGGTFDVGADVQLYDSIDCSGTPIPKATTSLKVKVIVIHIAPFVDAFWEWMLKFWVQFLALCSALFLFLIRKQLKRWFGFGKV